MPQSILLHSYSKMPFGKFKGFELGMVYLLDPSYINWMMLETKLVNYCVGDFEFLESLKVIDRFGDQGWLAHHVEADTEEFKKLWRPFVGFADLKFSGKEDYCFSSFALETNQEKLSEIPKIRISKTKLIPEEERTRYIFYPGTGISTGTVSMLPISVSTNSRGLPCVNFLMNNEQGGFSFYPARKDLKVAASWSTKWGIGLKEFESKVASKTPVLGRIKEGMLQINR